MSNFFEEMEKVYDLVVLDGGHKDGVFIRYNGETWVAGIEGVWNVRLEKPEQAPALLLAHLRQKVEQTRAGYQAALEAIDNRLQALNIDKIEGKHK